VTARILQLLLKIWSGPSRNVGGKFALAIAETSFDVRFHKSVVHLHAPTSQSATINCSVGEPAEGSLLRSGPAAQKEAPPVDPLSTCPVASAGRRSLAAVGICGRAPAEGLHAAYFDV
jgi:hypothetical protein